MAGAILEGPKHLAVAAGRPPTATRLAMTGPMMVSTTPPAVTTGVEMNRTTLTLLGKYCQSPNTVKEGGSSRALWNREFNQVRSFPRLDHKATTASATTTSAALILNREMHGRSVQSIGMTNISHGWYMMAVYNQEGLQLH